MAEKQVKSKQRVADHGEVFTAEREVNAMLDLVKNETERIESRFLEPACGDGNFLAEILRRKLAVVQKKYGGIRMRHDFEMWSVIAVMNIYGVELLPDNAATCRERLFKIWDEAYTANCKADALDECRDAVRYILERNILCGDALSMKQESGEPIIFAEWSFVTGTKVKRRDYRLDEMLEGHQEQMSLFMDGWEYDEEIDAFIPKPLKEYPLTDYTNCDGYAVIVNRDEFEERLPTVKTNGYALQAGEINYHYITFEDMGTMLTTKRPLNLAIKHPHFKYQNEYRIIISHAVPHGRKSIDYYFPADLCKCSCVVPIAKMVVGNDEYIIPKREVNFNG